jgi:hypothetical protein
MNYDTTTNFQAVYNELRLTNKKTAIAHGMGFSTTTQLDNSLSGKAMLSTKAVQNLVRNYNVNPTFLFTGAGAIFIGKLF